MQSPPRTQDTVIEMHQVGTWFGAHVVHKGLDLDVRKGEIFAVIGGSGSGKSTLLREMILLQKPSEGTIQVLGVSLEAIKPAAALSLRKRWGVMFQHGGLFGSLTVLENIGLPLREHTKLADAAIDAKALEKLSLAGLAPEVASQFPSELSGGMMKRASLARALILAPELLFLDEPTAGLYPESAAGVDTLVRALRDEYGLTVVMITHDLDLLWQAADRVAVLADCKVQATGSMDELSSLENPLIRPFFDGPRARSAQQQAQSAQPIQEPAWKPK
jgi:phospholipid/cholesterol/gamma-HCH transport system ATP-binding protein